MAKKTKRTEQVRYLLMSLKEAYSKFAEKHTDSKIGFSKFCEFRPTHVKLFEHIPHHVCVCVYHENVRLLLLALKDNTSLATEFHTFIDQVTCDSAKKECMSSSCADCRNLIYDFAPSSPTTTVTYQQWQNNDKVEKVNIIGTVGDAFAELKSKLKDFLLHTLFKRKQAAQVDRMIAQCDTENIVLQVDFSENATIASQHEIQSASHGQATLFTGYAWIDKEEKVNKSFVVISDELTQPFTFLWTTFSKYSQKHFQQQCF